MSNSDSPSSSQILVILGSARSNGDTKTLVDQLFDETPVKIIDLLDTHITPYNYEGIYPYRDEFPEIAELMLNHETIVFATPVYWYAMSGVMKNFFDRITDLVTIQKKHGRKLKGKNMALVSVSSDAGLPEGFHIPFQSTANYLDMNYLGHFHTATKKLRSGLEGKSEFLKLLM